MTVSSWKPKKMNKKISLLFADDLANAHKAPMEELNNDARKLEKELLAIRAAEKNGH